MLISNTYEYLISAIKNLNSMLLILGKYYAKRKTISDTCALSNSSLSNIYTFLRRILFSRTAYTSLVKMVVVQLKEGEVTATIYGMVR